MRMYEPPRPEQWRNRQRPVGELAPDRPRWMRRAAPVCVALPWLWIVVFWIGLFATAQSRDGLAWLSIMWMLCVLVLPAGVLGSVWSGQLRERGMMWTGIVGSVLLVPGFLLGFVLVLQVLYQLVAQ